MLLLLNSDYAAVKKTLIGYICNTHGYQRAICNGLDMKLT